MTSGNYDVQWVCAYCGRRDFPVPSMARLCEAKHEALEEEEAKGDEA